MAAAFSRRRLTREATIGNRSLGYEVDYRYIGLAIDTQRDLYTHTCRDDEVSLVDDEVSLIKETAMN